MSFKYGGADIAKAMQTFNAPVLALPEPPTDPTNKIAVFKWERNYVDVEKQMKTWEEANQ